jgi:hypothetical protein
MSISGINSPLNDPRAARIDDRAASTVRDQQASAAATTARPRPTTSDVAPARPSSRVANAVPVEAPPGTDPELWSVLTSEERAFFARASTQGPLTYSRMMAPQQSPAPAALPRGGRMDVRV